MSLVAYAGSDESDEEEQAEAVPSISNSEQISGHISDDEDHYAGVSSSTEGMYTSIFSDGDNATRETQQSEGINSTSFASLEDLPTPKKKENMEDSMPQETELETEVLPRAAELAAAPKPPPKKQRQPAKISIPSLNDDDGEEENAREKSKPSQKATGLFSLLPAPLHSSKKEINRPLIPHSVAKKPNPSLKKDTQVKEVSSSQSTVLAKAPQSTKDSDPSLKQMSTFNALTGYDSDSDDNDDVQGNSENFFSLNQNSDSTSKKEKGQEEQTAAVDSTVGTSENGDSVGEKSEEKKVDFGLINDAPLDFQNTNKLHSWSFSSYSNLLPVGPSGPVSSKALLQSQSYPQSYTMPEHFQTEMTRADVIDHDETDDTHTTEVPSEDLKQFMSDKEFFRLQGKRKRGLEEEINFVDARVDDYVDPSEVGKHMTEETEYVSAKKDKDNMPTSQQKRKKQITYLAYQAKEKEFELKNTWAQNRQTKQQTQSKYGF